MKSPPIAISDRYVWPIAIVLVAILFVILGIFFGHIKPAIEDCEQRGSKIVHKRNADGVIVETHCMKDAP